VKSVEAAELTHYCIYVTALLLNMYKQVLTVADALQEEVYEVNTNVCEQGDVGEAFYIIKEVCVCVCVLHILN
jgi:hypothetical protein